MGYFQIVPAYYRLSFCCRDLEYPIFIAKFVKSGEFSIHRLGLHCAYTKLAEFRHPFPLSSYY